MRALTVDDSRVIRRIVAKHLTPMGFEVEEAENGALGLETLRRCWPVDLVLVDWNMPVMNGLELVERIRSCSDFDPVKIVMVTTESESAQVERALSSGVDEYLMKPFDGEALRNTLDLLGLNG